MVWFRESFLLQYHEYLNYMGLLWRDIKDFNQDDIINRSQSYYGRIYDLDTILDYTNYLLDNFNKAIRLISRYKEYWRDIRYYKRRIITPLPLDSSNNLIQIINTDGSSCIVASSKFDNNIIVNLDKNKSFNFIINNCLNYRINFDKKELASIYNNKDELVSEISFSIEDDYLINCSLNNHLCFIEQQQINSIKDENSYSHHNHDNNEEGFIVTKDYYNDLIMKKEKLNKNNIIASYSFSKYINNINIIDSSISLDDKIYISVLVLGQMLALEYKNYNLDKAYKKFKRRELFKNILCLGQIHSMRS